MCIYICVYTYIYIYTWKILLLCFIRQFYVPYGDIENQNIITVYHFCLYELEILIFLTILRPSWSQMKVVLLIKLANLLGIPVTTKR